MIGYDPVLSVSAAREAGIQLCSNLDDVWAEADFVTLHTPLTPETRNLVSDATIDKCKTGVIFVNCARGGIIDEDALLRGLESGKVLAHAITTNSSAPPPPFPFSFASSRALLPARPRLAGVMARSTAAKSHSKFPGGRGLGALQVGGAALDVYPTEPPPESAFALLRHPRVVRAWNTPKALSQWLFFIFLKAARTPFLKK